jgi:hypothetical protein
LPKADHFFLRGFHLRPSLLDEFLEEHSKIEDLKKDFQATVSQQQKQIEALTADLQKLSAGVEAANIRRKWSTIPKAAPPLTKQEHFATNRHASPHGGFLFPGRAPEQQSRTGPRGNTKIGENRRPSYL